MWDSGFRVWALGFRAYPPAPPVIGIESALNESWNEVNRFKPCSLIPQGQIGSGVDLVWGIWFGVWGRRKSPWLGGWG